MNDSKSFSFLDASRNFSVHILDGQKLIQELAIIHNLNGEGFNFFRNTVLSAVHLSSFLKNNEGMGFFIDSEIPYFRFKIELNSFGTLRTLLIPHNFNEFPEYVTGRLRMSKVLPQSKVPYNSLIELNQTKASEIVNHAILHSYQTDVIVIPSKKTDHSFMFVKFPSEEEKTLKEFKDEHLDNLIKLCEESIDQQELIKEKAEKLGLTTLAEKDIKFKCNCSRDRMLLGLKDLLRSTPVEDVFENDKQVELKCDYCNTAYLILRTELESH